MAISNFSGKVAFVTGAASKRGDGACDRIAIGRRRGRRRNPLILDVGFDVARANGIDIDLVSSMSISRGHLFQVRPIT